MVNLPDWLMLSFRPAGREWLDLSAMRVAEYEQHLDLYRGILRGGFGFTYRGQRIEATITGDRVELAAARTGTGPPVTVRVAGRIIGLSPGERAVVDLTAPTA